MGTIREVLLFLNREVLGGIVILGMMLRPTREFLLSVTYRRELIMFVLQMPIVVLILQNSLSINLHNHYPPPYQIRFMFFVKTIVQVKQRLPLWEERQIIITYEKPFKIYSRSKTGNLQNYLAHKKRNNDGCYNGFCFSFYCCNILFNFGSNFKIFIKFSLDH